MSDECKDFISKVNKTYLFLTLLQLLEKDPVNRLGTKEGLDEIIKHPWFSTLDFNHLVEKKIETPFKPKLSADVFDVSNFDT